MENCEKIWFRLSQGQIHIYHSFNFKEESKNILFLQIKIQAQQYYAGKDNNRSVYFPLNEISVPRLAYFPASSSHAYLIIYFYW